MATDGTLQALTREFTRCLAAGVDTSSIATTVKASLADGSLNESKALAHWSALTRLG